MYTINPYSIFFLILGVVILIAGLVFFIPYSKTSKLRGCVTGKVVGITTDDDNNTIHGNHSYVRVGIGNKVNHAGEPNADMFHTVV